MGLAEKIDERAGNREDCGTGKKLPASDAEHQNPQEIEDGIVMKDNRYAMIEPLQHETERQKHQCRPSQPQSGQIAFVGPTEEERQADAGEKSEKDRSAAMGKIIEAFRQCIGAARSHMHHQHTDDGQRPGSVHAADSCSCGTGLFGCGHLADPLGKAKGAPDWTPLSSKIYRRAYCIGVAGAAGSVVTAGSAGADPSSGGMSHAATASIRGRARRARNLRIGGLLYLSPNKMTDGGNRSHFRRAAARSANFNPGAVLF